MAVSFVVMLFVLACPSVSVLGVKNALNICFNTVVPSLFPFFVLAKMFIKSGGAVYFGRILSPFIKIMFNVNPNGALPFVLGLISGYPLGAITVCDLYKKGDLSKDEAQSLLGFCNNSGPSFLIGAVGLVMMGSVKYGFMLYFVHILSSVSVGVMFRGSIKQKARINAIKIKKEKNAFTKSIEESTEAILSVCAYVVFFGVIIQYILLFTKNIFVLGFFEMTNALSILCENQKINMKIKFIIISSLASFSSLSVIMQTKRIISKTDLSFKKYVFAKCIQSVFSFVYSVILVNMTFFNWS